MLFLPLLPSHYNVWLKSPQDFCPLKGEPLTHFGALIPRQLTRSGVSDGKNELKHF